MANQKNEEESLEGATLYLAGINLAFYVITIAIGGQILTTGKTAIYLFGYSLISVVKYGFIWTPITSMFTHSSIAHLGGNMIFLLIYGFYLEEEHYSDKGIIYVYLITGLLASILSDIIFILLGIAAISVGASGAIFGLLGASAGVKKRRGSPELRSLIFASIILFLFSSIAPNTNLLAHLFGLIFGYFIGLSDWFDNFNEI